VLCNSTAANPVTDTRALANRLITDFLLAPALDTTAVDSATLARYAGVYRGERFNAMLELTPAMGREVRALPNGWLWSPGGARWHVDLGPAGRPTALRIAQPDGDTVRFSYVADKTWTPAPPTCSR